MLRHLRVTNFAILSDVELELGRGLNVLTGETGAGKSLIVEAVNLLRGGRASADIPRAGTDEATVEAIVEIPEDLRARVAAVLDASGLPANDDDANEVFIRRVIQRGGRSRTYVNGALTTAQRLAELGALLIDLSGQHQHQGLVDPSRHLELLDAFARASEPPSRGRITRAAEPTADRRAKKREGAEPDRRTLRGSSKDRAESGDSGSSSAKNGASDNGSSSAKNGTSGNGSSPTSAKDHAAESTALVESDAWPLAETMTVAWAELRRCDDELASLGGDERAREARVDYLRYQLEEVEAAAFQPGEDATIEIERARLASVDVLQSAARAAEEALYGGDDSARDRVAAAMREVERARRVDPSLEAVAKQLVEIETLIDDGADQLRSYADKLEGDPEKLAALDERLALIRRMLRKHAAGAIDDVIAKAAELRAELDGLLGRESRLADLTAARTRAEAAAVAAAAALTAARKAAARKLEKQVAAALAELGMGTAKITVMIEPRGDRGGVGEGERKGAAEVARAASVINPRGDRGGVGEGERKGAAEVARAASVINPRGDRGGVGEGERKGAAEVAPATNVITARALGPTGADRVELMLASNKGEDARPLAKIASGGELSRIMLALKLALQSAGRAEPVATYVFDEVDSGIGGATAQVVGSQIRALAGGSAELTAGQRSSFGASGEGESTRQVLCVTHLPQIAAFADHHFHVEKTEVGGRTETHVRRLTAAARKDELARMLGGHVTSKAKAHAAELLAEAARPQRNGKHGSS